MTAAQAEPLGCLIEPDQVAEIGTPIVGVIEQILVERGDSVRRGQVLARLTADVERASVSIAESRALAEAEVQSAAASANLAKRKLVRARYLVKQQFLSEQALEQADSEARVAVHAEKQAMEARDVADREMKLSSAQLEQRTIRSPFDGVVIERYRSVGERVDREAIAKLAKVDPLRVEVIVPAAQFGSVQEGEQFQVTPQLPQFGVQYATVTRVDRVIDAASNSFRVRLSMPNPTQRVPAGLRCKVDFTTASPGSKSAATPNGPAPLVPTGYSGKPKPTQQRGTPGPSSLLRPTILDTHSTISRAQERNRSA
jgi:RND family efflux transporter MFP subunit